MKPGTHQGHKDAMRSLKRRLSDTVYRQLLRDTMHTAVDPGGTLGGGSVVQRGQLKPLRWLFGQVDRTP